MKKTAVISDCGLYRYQLTRTWDESLPKVMFVMLNPSTADADNDDPTIRRCIGFAKDWGYGGILVGNCMAYRATDPEKLAEAGFLCGINNHENLCLMAEQAGIIVLAWGNWGACHAPLEFCRQYHDKLHHLGKTGLNQPKHPLYLSKSLKPIQYEPIKSS